MYFFVPFSKKTNLCICPSFSHFQILQILSESNVCDFYILFYRWCHSVFCQSVKHEGLNLKQCQHTSATILPFLIKVLLKLVPVIHIVASFISKNIYLILMPLCAYVHMYTCVIVYKYS